MLRDQIGDDDLGNDVADLPMPGLEPEILMDDKIDASSFGYGSCFASCSEIRAERLLTDYTDTVPRGDLDRVHMCFRWRDDIEKIRLCANEHFVHVRKNLADVIEFSDLAGALGCPIAYGHQINRFETVPGLVLESRKIPSTNGGYSQFTLHVTFPWC